MKARRQVHRQEWCAASREVPGDLARATVLFENAADLLKVLTELDGGGLGLEIAQLKNKFASPTPARLP